MADTGRTIYGGGGGGAGMGLTTPNFDTGWGPGFAFDSSAGTVDGSTIVIDGAYPIDSSPLGTFTTVAEDNDWFEWDPAAASGETPTLKRAGFYYVEFQIFISSPAADPWEARIGGTSAIAVRPGGFDQITLATILPLPADVYGLTFDKKANASITPTYGAMIFVPLFTP